MNKVLPIKIRRSDTSILDCLVMIHSSVAGKLSISGWAPIDGEYSGEDLFDALTELRRKLESLGARLLCAGSRTDVRPSGMSRSMGGGRKAYVLQFGLPATELLDIFEYATPNLVGTIDEQKAYSDEWLESLRK